MCKLCGDVCVNLCVSQMETHEFVSIDVWESVWKCMNV